jgi:hypothetical protein
MPTTGLRVNLDGSATRRASPVYPYLQPECCSAANWRFVPTLVIQTDVIQSEAILL